MSSPIEVQNTGIILNSEVTDNDLHLEFQKLHSKVKELEREKKEICDKFDAQRAKLQKLYVKKEDELKGVELKQISLEAEVERLTKELDDAKSQLYIAGLIKENIIDPEKQKPQGKFTALGIESETVELGTSQNEIKKPKQVIQMLEYQVNKFRGEKDKEGILLAPSNVISGAKSLARKFVGQLGNDSDYRNHEASEDNQKKVTEDAEIFRSTSVPQERRNQELEKSGVGEEKLKKFDLDILSRGASPNGKKKSDKSLFDLSFNASHDSDVISPKRVDSKSPSKETSDLVGDSVQCSVSSPRTTECDMCANYEAQLVMQQNITQQLEKQKEIIEANMERFKEDLIKETQFRKCMEDKWNEKKEEHKAQVSELKSLYEGAENDLKTLQKCFEKMQQDVQKELSSLRFDRERINEELKELQNQNDSLMGKHSAHSEQLRNESINFPDNVADLQELLLKSHEELIDATVAKESNERQVSTLRCELQLLRDQINTDLLFKSGLENNLALENDRLREQMVTTEQEVGSLRECLEKLKTADSKKEEKIRNLRSQIEKLTKEKSLCEGNISELRSRVGSLQQELDTSEAVQKDFVKLSQSLQIELEKIRGADTEVRWEHDEDAVECRGCKIPLVSGKKWGHCRHCGKIFCSSCLRNYVLSGPHNRPSHVCQVCHTLLNSETAPYFSQEPPHLLD